MSNNKMNQTSENKKETCQNQEKDNRFLQGIQLLSSLKSIPGKIIPLDNKIEIPKKAIKYYDNEKNDVLNSKKKPSINKIFHKSKSLFTPKENPNNNTKNTKNNININNTFIINNFFFNNERNNTNKLNLEPIFNKSFSIGIFQDQSGYFNNPGYCPSGYPSILSFKSDMRNYMPSENKYSQNCFYLQNMLLNNGNQNDQNDISQNKNNDMSDIISNIFSQLSFHQHDLEKEVFLKKKRSTNLLFRKESNNHLENSINHISINNVNIEKKKSFLIFNEDNENSRKENKNILNVNEGEKEISYNNKKNNNIKILFNIENYIEESYEEEKDNLFHNKSDKLENNNIFSCIHKKIRRKIYVNKKYKCAHPLCNNSYKTLNQLQNHHYKMASKCHVDTVYLLKLIYNSKIVLLNLIKNNLNKKEYFSNLYKKSVNSITLEKYVESITGVHLDDIIQ